MNETALRKWCLEYLASIGVMAWKNNSGVIQGVTNPGSDKTRPVSFGTKGSADILGILASQEGRILCIECKVGDNRLSHDQAVWLQRAYANGAAVGVIYSTEDMVAYAECGFGSDVWKRKLDDAIAHARPPKTKKLRRRNGFGPKIVKMKCPRDTDGDGNCGYKYCPVCGTV